MAEANSKWSSTASSYVRYFQPSSLLCGRVVVNGLQLNHAGPLKIVETGAGTGALAKDVLGLDGVDVAEYCCSDMADGMVEKAKATLAGTAARVEKLDCRELPFADASFDRYVSNCTLHYLPDPAPAVKEASRVLRPGGLAGFSVWGHPASSPLMTIVPDVLDALGLEKKDPAKRSSFHLGENDDATRQLFLTNGFTKCAIVHVPLVMSYFDPDHYVELIIDGANSTKTKILSFSPDDQIAVRQEVKRRAKLVMDQGQGIALDVAVIIAQR